MRSKRNLMTEHLNEKFVLGFEYITVCIEWMLATQEWMLAISTTAPAVSCQFPFATHFRPDKFQTKHKINDANYVFAFLMLMQLARRSLVCTNTL